MLTYKATRHLHDLTAEVVEEFVSEIDPHEERYPDFVSIEPLLLDLKVTLAAAIADWEIEQRQAMEVKT
jgi:hypothetical protein